MSRCLPDAANIGSKWKHIQNDSSAIMEFFTLLM